MEPRKNPRKDLNKYSILFFQTGLLTALMLAVFAFEFEAPVTSRPVDILKMEETPLYVVPVTSIKVPEPPKPKPRPINPNPVESTTPEKVEETVEIQVPTSEPSAIIETIAADLPPVEEAPEFVDYAEVMPEPEGGMEAFYKYLSKNLKYTSQAKRMDIQGKVFIQFIVDENGKLTQVKVIQGLGAGLDEEAIRVIEASPQWNSGRQGGRKVRVRMVMPITFKLN